MQRITSPPALPPRPLEGHKGTFGRVLVVGGNDGMIGAPVLAGTAALRMGAGLVQIAVPRSILAACLSITPELIGLGLGKAAGKDQLLEAGEAPVEPQEASPAGVLLERADDLVFAEILQGLAVLAPGQEVEIGRAHV